MSNTECTLGQLLFHYWLDAVGPEPPKAQEIIKALEEWDEAQVRRAAGGQHGRPGEAVVLDLQGLRRDKGLRGRQDDPE